MLSAMSSVDKEGIGAPLCTTQEVLLGGPDSVRNDVVVNRRIRAIGGSFAMSMDVMVGTAKLPLTWREHLKRIVVLGPGFAVPSRADGDPVCTDQPFYLQHPAERVRFGEPRLRCLFRRRPDRWPLSGAGQ